MELNRIILVLTKQAATSTFLNIQRSPGYSINWVLKLLVYNCTCFTKPEYKVREFSLVLHFILPVLCHQKI